MDDLDMHGRDELHRFVLEDAGARGALVRLDASWQTVLERRDYPEAVRDQLGQALAAGLLLAATIKFEGSLTLQAQAEGPLRLLLAHATDERTIRGLAHWDAEVPSGGLREVFGSGVLGITIDVTGGERYQGIVPLEGDNLAEALRMYFTRSEQLDTYLWLHADGERAAGFLLQRLPDTHHPEDWDRVAMLASTVTESDLLLLPAEKLLLRLFNQEQVRLFDAERISFRCSCSQERIENAIRALGRAEAMDIIEERGAIDADCEFCNRHYRLDRIDVERLFVETTRVEVPPTRH
jgi:molecular chaperone Hsp33